MRTPPLLLAGALLLTGCTLASAPSPTPTAAPATAAGAAYPSVVPGTDLIAGPTPGTVRGRWGGVLRFVPADPSLSLECRKLTDAERVRVSQTLTGAVIDSTRPARAVDLPEAGFAVVAYWGRVDGGERQTFALVTGGGRSSDLYPGWPGTHGLAGVAFADGPKVAAAALECIGG